MRRQLLSLGYRAVLIPRSRMFSTIAENSESRSTVLSRACRAALEDHRNLESDIYKSSTSRSRLESSTKIVELLVEAGARVNGRKVCECAEMADIMHEAISTSFHKLLPQLLLAGADTCGRNKDGMTSLHAAIRISSDIIASLLLKAGADVSVRDAEGLTALHAAVLYCSDPSRGAKIVSLLLEAGGSVNSQNSEGLTPLDSAVSGRKVQVVLLLLKAGAILNTDAVENK